MKNLFIALGVLAMIGATSCKKEYTCECQTTFPDGSKTTATTKIKDTKKKAKDACDKLSSSANGMETKCDIK